MIKLFTYLIMSISLLSLASAGVYFDYSSNYGGSAQVQFDYALTSEQQQKVSNLTNISEITILTYETENWTVVYIQEKFYDITIEKELEALDKEFTSLQVEDSTKIKKFISEWIKEILAQLLVQKEINNMVCNHSDFKGSEACNAWQERGIGLG